MRSQTKYHTPPTELRKSVGKDIADAAFGKWMKTQSTTVIERGRRRAAFRAYSAWDSSSRAMADGPRPRDPGTCFDSWISSPTAPASLDQRAWLLSSGLGQGFNQIVRDQNPTDGWTIFSIYAIITNSYMVRARRLRESRSRGIAMVAPVEVDEGGL